MAMVSRQLAAGLTVFCILTAAAKLDRMDTASCHAASYNGQRTVSQNLAMAVHVLALYFWQATVCVVSYITDALCHPFIVRNMFRQHTHRSYLASFRPVVSVKLNSVSGPEQNV